MTVPLQELGENNTPGKMLSAPRHGPSVLSGLLVCCLSDHRMLVGYSNTSAAKTLRYSCQREAIDYGADVCQRLSGAVLESFVVERLWQAVSPASIALSLAATADIERARKQLDDRWQQRLARSRYEVEQSRRGYQKSYYREHYHDASCPPRHPADSKATSTASRRYSRQRTTGGPRYAAAMARNAVGTPVAPRPHRQSNHGLRDGPGYGDEFGDHR